MATVRGVQPFNPETAAQGLRSAMKGLGTNEDEIAQIVGTHNNAQRQQIKIAFKTMFGRDLDHDIKSEISGHFLWATEAALALPVVYDARELHRAMHGPGTKESVLTEILSSHSCADITVLKQVYKQEFSKELEEALHSETSGNFRHLVISLCNAQREQNPYVNDAQAQEDAQKLFNAGEGKRWGTDEDMFNFILCKRSIPQLQRVFHFYAQVAGHDIEDAIKRETHGDLQTGYLAVVKCTKNRSEYFAEQIYHAMKGAGTNDHQMIYVIVSRSEIDLAVVAQDFQRLYNHDLKSFVEGECSHHYKKILLYLLGPVA